MSDFDTTDSCWPQEAAANAISDALERPDKDAAVRRRLLTRDAIAPLGGLLQSANPCLVVAAARAITLLTEGLGAWAPGA